MFTDNTLTADLDLKSRMVSRKGVVNLLHHWNKYCWTSGAILLVLSLYYGAKMQSRMSALDHDLSTLRESASQLNSLDQERVKHEVTEKRSKIRVLSVQKRSAVEIKEDQYGIMDGGGVAYVHWGRRDCPTGSSLTVLVHSGYVAGTHYTHGGGGSNYLCIDANITYHSGRYDDGNKGSSYIYGAELRDAIWMHSLFDLSDTEKNYLRLNSMPCAVCLAQLMITQIMIPGRSTCPKGWTLEYKGYIMGGGHSDTHASKFICVDQTPQVVPGTNADEKGANIQMVESQCASLLCEPFVVSRELQCVVCTY